MLLAALSVVLLRGRFLINFGNDLKASTAPAASAGFAAMLFSVRALFFAPLSCTFSGFGFRAAGSSESLRP